MSEPMIFYDIPATDGIASKAWSANTWKTRYVLNYKHIPYKTHWVEYPDIEGLCKTLGVAPAGKTPDGLRELYTLPMIYDPSTARYIVDSYAIAVYLEETYPDTPRIFGVDDLSEQHAFVERVQAGDAFKAPFRIILGRIVGVLNPEVREYFRSTREARFGVRLEELNTREQWGTFEAAWADLSLGYRNREVLEEIRYADFVVAAVLVCIRTVCGPESEDWERVARRMQGGFWGRFLEQFERYHVVQ